MTACVAITYSAHVSKLSIHPSGSAYTPFVRNQAFMGTTSKLSDYYYSFYCFSSNVCKLTCQSFLAATTCTDGSTTNQLTCTAIGKSLATGCHFAGSGLTSTCVPSKDPALALLRVFDVSTHCLMCTEILNSKSYAARYGKRYDTVMHLVSLLSSSRVTCGALAKT